MFERKGDIGFLRSAPEKDDLGYVYYYYYYYYYISLLYIMLFSAIPWFLLLVPCMLKIARLL